jgi:superoxide reductase
MEMTQRDEVYKCEACGNLIGVIHGAGGDLVCCGQKMVLLKANSTDASVEKHVPVITQNGKMVKVTVGAVPHPMEEKHYIEVIGVSTEDKLYRAYLKPGGKPEASFEIEGKIKCARAYCNIHGMWKS